ncbi:MAG: lytic transglycosylase domain-containing protein [Candidatus Alcyoniella australis]|nr:lytic transglycosylase domain-containing protein [Candidatus Alcyoniella australis]
MLTALLLAATLAVTDAAPPLVAAVDQTAVLHPTADALDDGDALAQMLSGKTEPDEVRTVAPHRGRYYKPEQIELIITRVAIDEQINPYLALALIETESSLNPYAASPAGALGLTQMLPATARRFGVENIWDPEQNVRGGLRYLKFLLGIFDGDLRLALAAYNAGIPAVLYYGDVPPYSETRSFVARIFRRFSERMFQGRN